MPVLYGLYPPEAQSQDRAIGIKLPFNRDAWSRKYNTGYNEISARSAGLFELSYTTEDQAISNLINLLLTRKGERYMHPDFGSRIPDFLFEQNVPEERFVLENDIRRDIARWLPYIVLDTNRGVSVDAGNRRVPGDPLHAVTITVRFRVNKSGANVVVEFFVDRDRIEFQTSIGN